MDLVHFDFINIIFRDNSIKLFNQKISIIALLSTVFCVTTVGLDNIDLKQLRGKNVAIVANHTSIDSKETHILDIISKISDIYVHVVFAPEHGFKGNLSAGAFFDDAITPLYKIVSLYGKNKAPKKEDLLNIDVIIFDIQDIGSRYYTYISTLTYVMEAAANFSIPLIVLDRPNPLGRLVDGPLLNMEYASFVGMHPIPIRHGMTIGEIALMIAGEGWLKSKNKLDLEVVKLEGWNVEMGYFSIPPSPNIPNHVTSLIYNGMCLLEGTNLSEGRGTETPFLLFGAPWLNGYKLTSILNKLKLPGIKFEYSMFKPVRIRGKADWPKYRYEMCQGVKIKVLNMDKVDPIRMAIHIIGETRALHPDEFIFLETNFIDKLYGNESLKLNILSHEPIENLFLSWQEDNNRFSSIRKQYLLY